MCRHPRVCCALPALVKHQPGRSRLDPETELILSKASDERRSTRRVHALTRTQVAIVDLIAEGRTDKEIAHSVGMSYRTVRTHLERLYDLNAVHCRAALVAVVAQRRQTLGQQPEPNSAKDRQP